MVLPQSANVQAFWKFEEAAGDLMDETDNDYDLTTGNAPTYSATGIVEDCCDWNGSTDYMIHANCDLFNGWEELTVMVWVKTPNNVDANYRFPIRLIDNAAAYSFAIFKGNDKYIYTRTGTTDTTHGLKSDNVIVAKTWYCIICRYKRNVANSVNFIINDVDQANTASPGDFAMSATGNQSLSMGARDDASQAWDGLIDEVVIWNKYLSDAECTTLYALGSPDRSLYSLAVGTNMEINIGDAWKDIDSMEINISDVWKDVASTKINIGDAWKDIF